MFDFRERKNIALHWVFGHRLCSGSFCLSELIVLFQERLEVKNLALHVEHTVVPLENRFNELQSKKHLVPIVIHYVVVQIPFQGERVVHVERGNHLTFRGE